MSILDEIVAHKRDELGRRRREVPLRELERRGSARPAPRDFARALTPPPGGIRLLAEVKKASPSRGVLSERFDPLALAETYAGHGAAALSVLTDEKYFQGSLEFLTAIRERVEVPVLRKDFTLDEYHLWEARAAGADAVLLIVSILDAAALRDLHETATGLGLAALVEAHTASEIDVALTAGARIVGINNRDLKTFETRIETTLELLPLIPAGRLAVSESGFFTAEQVRTVAAAGAHAVLVGEALVRAPDVAAKVRELALGDPGGHVGAPRSGRL
jgi:indole-3-glycerol phosphate synthase